MSYRHQRPIQTEIDQIDKKILREIESLKDLERYSSRVDNKTNNQNTHKGTCKAASKVIQIKPSSRQDKGYTISEVKMANSYKDNNYKYQDRMETRKSNKENQGKNPMNNIVEYDKKRSGNNKTNRHMSSIRTHLKTETTRYQQMDYATPHNHNHYASTNLVNDNLFENYDLSNSNGDEEQEDLLFPEDSLNFSLKEQIPKQTQIKQQNKQSKGVKQDYLNLFEIANQRSQSRNVQPKTRNSGGDEYTFKPKILDKSKEMAERLGSSYTRLTKSKHTPKQNTYRENPSRSKAYSRERMETLSKPRAVSAVPEEQVTNECTFKPVLSKKSLNQFNACYLDIIERNMLWQNQRQQKLQKLRESNEQQKNQKLRMQCSAVKIKSNYNPNQEVAFSRFVKDGLIGHFQRVNQVNETKKREKEAESKFSGKGWNGSVTKPQEFKLSSSSPNELSYRSRGKSVMMNSVGSNPVQREYEKAVKEVHEKIRQLNLMI